MEANCIKATQTHYLKSGEESFGKIKRIYKKPLEIMGYWESMARTK
jgi:hypothetical protein